jgi:hypothetical protein
MVMFVGQFCAGRFRLPIDSTDRFVSRSEKLELCLVHVRLNTHQKPMPNQSFSSFDKRIVRVQSHTYRSRRQLYSNECFRIAAIVGTRIIKIRRNFSDVQRGTRTGTIAVDASAKGPASDTGCPVWPRWHSQSWSWSGRRRAG